MSDQGKAGSGKIDAGRTDAAKAGESLVGGLGASALHTYRLLAALLLTLISAWKSSTAPGLGAQEVCRALTVRQIFYTSFQALSMISVVALFVGATLTAQSELLGGPLQRETAGRVLVTVIVRELAPLITAILVAGRSGTAIATEIGVMRVNSEILALASLGIDPPRFIVWPRIVSTTVSVPLLTVYFSTMAVLGGFIALFFIDAHAVSEFRSGAVLGLSLVDLPLVLVKAVGLGGLIGWICSYYGFEVGSSPTEVPQKASKAVVQSLMACIIYNAVITMVFYGLLVGGRLQ
jgi:phospholipid/cholesterol/gamma-HCH transport system permease protein